MRYETDIKLDNGRWLFLGWYELKENDFLIEQKETKNFIYQTFHYKSGSTEVLRYRK